MELSVTQIREWVLGAGVLDMLGTLVAARDWMRSISSDEVSGVKFEALEQIVNELRAGLDRFKN